MPDALKPWESWVTWNDTSLNSPTTYRSADERIAVWPSVLSMAVDQNGGNWQVAVRVFAQSWVGLPGDADIWPVNVTVDGQAVPVVERNGRPAVQLRPGNYQLVGGFQWDNMPQRIAIPREIGIMSLTVNGQAIAMPRWDTDGHVWLQRVQAEEAEKDLLGAQVYRVIVDGIPTQLITEIELTVSGKSREENLGWILPEGFKLSTVSGPIPVAVDEQGRMKAQVRAGKWTITATAFRLENRGDVQYAANAQPIINEELIAFQAKPEFRLAEVEGLVTTDVTLTTFPAKWRQLPVYTWDTSSGFSLTEKMRGMGLQRPMGLSVARQFWLDEDGAGLTFRDRISGQMQQIWRLDAAAGQELGAVRIDGKGQLITENPKSGLNGVELRSRNLDLNAIGRIENIDRIAATGWDADVDQLNATFILPPGWRALAVFGADRIEGDWLTAWSLLDLFLLLVFTMAMYRIWGLPAGLVAFVAFGLAYHEPGSPRWTWLFLLVPVALLRVVPEGIAKKLVQAWRLAAVAMLIINLVPFVAHQLQTAIFPQLEMAGVNYAARNMPGGVGSTYRYTDQIVNLTSESADFANARQSVALAETEGLGLTRGRSKFQVSNMKYDPATRIQTGPAEPQWSWNIVNCYWEGPVPTSQTIRPVLVSLQMHRVLTVARVLLVLLLAAILLGVKKSGARVSKAAVVASSVLLLMCLSPATSEAQDLPNQQMLDTLRQRLLEPPDVYPNAAEIARVDLVLTNGQARMTAEVHAAASVAVPLPGKLPVWSPVSVSVDDQPAQLVARKDDYLWVVVPAGVHQVTVESLLPDVSEWEWTFVLKPRRVAVDADGWTVTGVGLNGVPDQQLLFSRQQQAIEAEAAYDQKDFNPIIVVDRHLEIGLIWQLRTEVTRISADNRAVSLRIPLLQQESVLSSNVRVENGFADVALGSAERSISWNSEIPVGAEIQLDSRTGDGWIERWHLVTSPVWNMTQTGLAPVFESQQENLIPVWHPWPGEQAVLSFDKPKAVQGEILTIQKIDHEVAMRQRDTTLTLELECSIGSDFRIGLPPDASITSLRHDNQDIPVRRDEQGMIVAIRPGRQQIEVKWNTDAGMELVADTGQVSLPVQGSNVTTIMQVPDSRWVLWADGPLRGPAVRFWTILVTAVLIALLLGRVPHSPLSYIEWALLSIGLTQINVVAAIFVVGWLLLLSRRGTPMMRELRPSVFNLLQVGIVILTLIALGIFVVIVGKGLLGHPDMFIIGNGSSRTYLKWFQPRIDTDLPIAKVVSISVWFYRLLMLFWALWLANSLVRWLKWGWQQFSDVTLWKASPKIVTASPSGQPYQADPGKSGE